MAGRGIHMQERRRADRRLFPRGDGDRRRRAPNAIYWFAMVAWGATLAITTYLTMYA
jgi:hypothetical protein